MSVEVATVLAHLTDRRLSLPFDEPIPPAPRSSIDRADQGRPARILDLLELPVDIVHPDEWTELEMERTESRGWDRLGDSVVLCHDDLDESESQFVDFANGRTNVHRLPHSDAPILRIDGRLLSFYSYVFYARPAMQRRIRALVRGVRARRPYVELASSIAADLPGRFHAVHIRRSDLTTGIAAYGDVTPEMIAANLAEILPTDQLLVVCSEVDEADELFDPLRERFRELVWANNLILGDHRSEFFALPRHEDNALGLVTQELASRSGRFVGTIGSTFTALIQRLQRFREPDAPFLYTADFTPEGPKFDRGEFLERRDGSYTWNRIGYEMSPDVLAWFREWPEAT